MTLTLSLLFVAASASCFLAPVAGNPTLYTKSDTIAPVSDDVNYRLPPNLSPVSYKVQLIPDLAENFTFEGSVQITFQVMEETPNITLHTNMIDVDTESIVLKRLLDLGEDEPYVVESTDYDQLRHFYTITLNDTLPKDRYFKVSMQFTGKLHDDMQGFYRSSYVAKNGERRWLGATQFQAVHARRAFPCFDEPALRAKFTISISRPQAMNTVANMPLDRTEQHLNENGTHNGRFWDIFEETPNMPTYLVAFIVSDFEHLADETENLRIFAQPPMVEQANYSLQVSPPILNWLANFTEIPYMLPKMDEAAIPDFDAGAMENWGLATYRERLLLLQEGVSTSDTKQRIATVIAHEYAHQWFGDLVTPFWWTYAWLNEGFATYFEYFATANVETTWRLEEQFVVKELQDAMASDSLETSHPMTFDVCSPASINAIFDAIIYNKAGSVIRMMKHMISPEIFRLGLKSYLTDRSYSTATADQLYFHLNNQLQANSSGEGVFDLPTVMKTWSDQMGYPVIHVIRHYELSTAEVTQERFLLKKDPNMTDPHIYKWFIPLTYTARSEADFEATSTLSWLKPEQDKTIVPHANVKQDQWILYNIQQTGYYRVNYDEQNWQLLSEHMDSDNYTDIHVLNRAQLIDDSFNLARAGHINYSIPLDMSRFLKREVDYVPWVSAFNAFSFLMGKLSNSADFAHLQTYLKTLINNLYEHVGFEEGEQDDHVTKLNRAAAVNWACDLKQEDCTSKAVDLFGQWMNDTATVTISPDLKKGVYCTALREGAEEEWNFLFDQYIATAVSSEQTLIISALGCTKNTTILKNYLESSIAENSTVRRQDARAVFTAVYTNTMGVDIALDFLINNFKEMAAFYGGLNSMSSMLSGIANRLNTEEQANKLKEFLAANEGDLADAGTAVQNAINIVDETLEWQAASAEYIFNWIKYEVGAVPSTPPTPSTPTTPSVPTTPDTPTTTPGSAGAASLSSLLLVLALCVYVKL